MERLASKIIEELENNKYTGEITLIFKTGGLSNFSLLVNKKNWIKIKIILDKLKTSTIYSTDI